MLIEDHPSPNWGPRRNGITPSLVVLHYTAMESCEAACARLCDPEAEVSSHYLIDRTGTVLRLVDEDHRAWHAGSGAWDGADDINSRSIGIELDNRGTHPFSAPQMDSLEILLTSILKRWTIAPEGVIGHSDMAPSRKIDPGPHFDWERLERAGLAGRRGQGPAARAADWNAFRTAAKAKGYTNATDNEALLAAVRLRYRPWATGPLSADDITPLL